MHETDRREKRGPIQLGEDFLVQVNLLNLGAGEVGDEFLLLLVLLEPDEDDSDMVRPRVESSRRMSSSDTERELRVARLWRVSSSSRCSVNLEVTMLESEEHDDLGVLVSLL
jgi:hypothetical protein